MHFTHHSVQDALLQVMADIILEEIRDEVTIASYFGIICDETAEKRADFYCSALFFDNIIHEEFIGFRYAESVNAENLHKYRRERLDKVGVAIQGGPAKVKPLTFCW